MTAHSNAQVVLLVLLWTMETLCHGCHDCVEPPSDYGRDEMVYTVLGPESFEGPADFIARCVDLDAAAILVPHGVLPKDFFDLSSGVAGDVVQKLVNYGIRIAVVVPDLTAHSARFQEFAREASKRRHFGFFPDRAAAVAWLESA